MNTSQPAHGFREMAIGAGIVLGPERHAEAPVSIEAAAVTVVPAGRKHQAGELKFRFFLRVRRRYEAVIFDARILPEWFLGVQTAEENKRAGRDGNTAPKTDPHCFARHCLARRISLETPPGAREMRLPLAARWRMQRIHQADHVLVRLRVEVISDDGVCCSFI